MSVIAISVTDRLRGRYARSGAGRYTGVLIAVLALSIVLGITQDGFLTASNIENLLQTNAALLICSVGMTFVVLVGGFDLSVSGALALGGVAMALLITAGVPAVLAVAIVLLSTPVAAFLTNGILIALANLNFFVVTIATNAVFAGLALVLSNGATIPLYNDKFVVRMGTSSIAGIPVSIVIAAGVVAGSGLLLRYTGFGRMIYSVGGNSEAARLAGIPVRSTRAGAYVICTTLAVVAGVVMVGRIQGADPEMGSGIALQAAAAVLLGGTSFLGGEGGVVGTVFGVLFLGLLANGLTLAGISGFWQGVITGFVLLGAILIDRFRPRTFVLSPS